jgi:hypothetical protein
LVVPKAAWRAASKADQMGARRADLMVAHWAASKVSQTVVHWVGKLVDKWGETTVVVTAAPLAASMAHRMAVTSADSRADWWAVQKV